MPLGVSIVRCLDPFIELNEPTHIVLVGHFFKVLFDFRAAREKVTPIGVWFEGVSVHV